MLIEMLMLLFNIYWWMQWFKGDDLLSEITDLLGQNG